MKKNIVGLIALVAIIAVAIFAGCIEEEVPTSTPTPTFTPTFISTPTLTPIPTLDTIKIDVTSTTWREGEKPYDVYSVVEKKLKKAGFKVVPKDNGVYNATLFVNYREEKDGEYMGGGYGTDIKCNIQLVHKNLSLLFEKKIAASTPFLAGNLYRDAVQNFENKVYFKYLGEILASKYGTGSEVSVIISALINDKSSGTRADAAEVLGEIGDERAVEPLINALRDADYTVQRGAAEALGKIGDKKAVEPLITTLKTEDEYLRERAAEALGEIGDKKAVEPLINALKDEDESVRSSATEALGQIGDARAVEPLIDALKDEDWYVRCNAAEALGEIGDKRAIEPLTAALNDKDEYVRSSAETALEKIRGF
ncbi:MAG: HEAT repeat domain-containing protein [Halobacteriota archaeon]